MSQEQKIVKLPEKTAYRVQQLTDEIRKLSYQFLECSEVIIDFQSKQKQLYSTKVSKTKKQHKLLTLVSKKLQLDENNYRWKYNSKTHEFVGIPNKKTKEK